jgi:hypothetical protein
MWCATVVGFFSVIRDRQLKGGVLVRAGAKADILNLHQRFSKRYRMSYPKADEHRDYRWRVGMRKTARAQIICELSMQIDYCNFKNAVHNRPDQDNKHSAYLAIWSAMMRVQRGEDPVQQQSVWDRELD